MMLFYRIIYFHSFQWLIFFFVYLNVKFGRFQQEETIEVIWDKNIKFIYYIQFVSLDIK